MTLISTLRTGLFAAAILAAPVLAHAEETHNSVKDKSGGNVVDARGNCVRTKWDAGIDPCAPASSKKKSGLHSEELVVYFAFNSSTLTKQEARKLDAVADVLKKSNGLTSATVIGYADKIGGAEYNRKLSVRRAQSVQQYLAQKGYVDKKKAEIRGLGQTDSQSRCDDIKNRAKLIECLWKDRRVEIELQLKK